MHTHTRTSHAHTRALEKKNEALNTIHIDRIDSGPKDDFDKYENGFSLARSEYVRV